MKRTFFVLLVASLFAGAATAADSQTSRSVGSHPIVHDDYPEADLVLEADNGILLSVTGEARTRFEWVENAVDFSSSGRDGDGDDAFFDDDYYFAPSRFNLGFRVDLPRDVAAVVEVQGAFDWGEGLETRQVNNEMLRPASVNPANFWLGVADTLFGSDGRANGGVRAGSSAARVARLARDLEATDQVSIYQAYVETANMGDSIFSMRIGRQELAYGTEFMLGNRDFYDGISYDAIKGILEFSDNSRLDLFWAKQLESQLAGGALGTGLGLLGVASNGVAVSANDNDIDFYGAYFSTQSLGGSSIGMDAYALGLNNNLSAFVSVDTDDDHVFFDYSYVFDTGRSHMESYWVGVRFFREALHGWHFSAELAYQFGDIEAEINDQDDDDLVDFDIGAWAFEGFLGYTWDTPTNPGIHLGVTYATGSSFSDIDNADWNTFFAPQSEVHPRLGLMDMVEPSNVLAANVGYSGSKDNHSWGVDLWHFEYDEVNPLTEAFVFGFDADAVHMDDEIGQEVDLWYNYQYSKNLVAQFAIGYFNAGQHFEEWNRCVFGNCDDEKDAFDDDDIISTSDAWRVYANILLRF